MIDYHPYDVRINGETDVNAHNIAEIEQKCKDKTTIKFVTIDDACNATLVRRNAGLWER